MRAAISLLVLLLSMCGVQAESNGTDFDLSTELKELKDMVRVSESKVKVLEADNVAMKQRLAASDAEQEAVRGRLVASETKVAALERALQDTKAHLEKEIKAAPKVAFSVGLYNSNGGSHRAGGDDLNLVFKSVFTNVGEAYSSTTGFFTAPVRGVYYFRFNVAGDLNLPSGSQHMGLYMYRNEDKLIWLGSDVSTYYLSSGLTLQLEKGDTVRLVLPAGGSLWDNSENRCTFSGFLLFPL